MWKLCKQSLVLGVALIACEAHAGSEMKYFSMNLFCAENDWQNRIEVLAREISRLDPDVAGFQEVCRGAGIDVVATLVESLKREGYPVAFQHAVFTHRTFFKYGENLLLISKHVPERVATGVLPGSAPAFENRYLAMQLKGQWYVNTHLNWIFPTGRAEQYRFLSRVWGGLPAIVGGDLNSGPLTWEGKKFAALDWIPFFAGPTHPSSGPKRVFDGFWLSPRIADEIEVLGVERLFAERASALSDHLAVMLTVRNHRR